MPGPRRQQRSSLAALAVAALCLLVPIITNPITAAASEPTDSRHGLPGVPLTLTAGNIRLSTGLAVAELSNGANGPVLLTIGPCVPDLTTSCSGVLSEILLLGDFKDADGDPVPGQRSDGCQLPPTNPRPRAVVGMTT